MKNVKSAGKKRRTAGGAALLRPLPSRPGDAPNFLERRLTAPVEPPLPVHAVKTDMTKTGRAEISLTKINGADKDVCDSEGTVYDFVRSQELAGLQQKNSRLLERLSSTGRTNSILQTEICSLIEERSRAALANSRLKAETALLQKTVSRFRDRERLFYEQSLRLKGQLQGLSGEAKDPHSLSRALLKNREKAFSEKLIRFLRYRQKVKKAHGRLKEHQAEQKEKIHALEEEIKRLAGDEGGALSKSGAGREGFQYLREGKEKFQADLNIQLSKTRLSKTRMSKTGKTSLPASAEAHEKARDASWLASKGSFSVAAEGKPPDSRPGSRRGSRPGFLNDPKSNSRKSVDPKPADQRSNSLDYQKQVSFLIHKLKESRAALKEAREKSSRFEILERRFREAQKAAVESARLTDENRLLQETVRVLEEESRRLAEQEAGLSSKLIPLMKYRKKVQAAHPRLKSALQNFKEREKSLFYETGVLKKQLENFQKEKSVFIKQKEDLQKNLAEREARLAALKSETASLKEKLKSPSSSPAKSVVAKQIKDLKSRLKERERQIKKSIGREAARRAEQEARLKEKNLQLQNQEKDAEKERERSCRRFLRKKTCRSRSRRRGKPRSMRAKRPG